MSFGAFYAGLSGLQANSPAARAQPPAEFTPVLVLLQRQVSGIDRVFDAFGNVLGQPVSSFFAERALFGGIFNGEIHGDLICPEPNRKQRRGGLD